MSIEPGLDLAEFAREHRVRFVPMAGWRAKWRTMGRTIYYPGRIPDPLRHRLYVEHEYFHVLQFERLGHLHNLLYWIFPLPFFLAWYRWRCEREPHLHNIRHHGVHVEGVVSRLWSSAYGWCWPRAWARRWFERELGR